MVNLPEIINALQQFVTRLNTKVDHLEAQVDQSQPKSDAHGASGQAHLDLGNQLQVRSGRVSEVLPFFGWYRVTPDQGNAIISCCLIADTALTPVGVVRIGALQPSARVFYVKHPRSGYGCIIGVEPPYVSDRRQAIADYISQASANTPASQQVVTSLLQIQKNGIIDFSNGRPIDETAVGEWGYIAETGVAVFVDSFMAFLRADENTGFWAFYHDQLARVAGHNLQIRSGGREDEQFDDEDEFSREVGITPYPHEALGAFAKGTDPTQANDATATQQDAPYKANLDTRHDDQAAFYRLREYQGYLGQGFRRVMVLPPEAGTLNRLSEPAATTAVWEEALALDGHYFVRSAQGVTISLTPPWAPPTRKKRPEDKTGDSREGGYDNSAHKIQAPLDATGEHPGAVRALAADDDTAYSMQWRGDHPFHYHEKDFDLREPAAVQGLEDKVPFGVLAEQQYFDAPEPAELTVDHRYKAKFYKLMSMIKLLPGGNMVFAGGHGEEIRFIDGSVEIGTPGDVLVRSGRTTAVLAGRDAIVRGYKNVELSAATEDVRIKGHFNTQITAGVSGQGALLLESRAKGVEQEFTNKVGTDVKSNGVLIKSQGLVAILSTNDVYVRSGAEGKTGSIILDAAKSGGDVLVQARTAYNLVENSVFDAFGKDGTYTDANWYSKTATVVCGFLMADKDLLAKGYAQFEKSVFVAQGHVFTADADTYNNMVPKLDDPGLGQVQSNLEKIRETINDATAACAEFHGAALEDRHYGTDRVGDDETEKFIQFSFRSTTQCKTDNFKLYESRWQQRSRLAGGTTQVWTEPPVEAGSDTTYPWPGKDCWTGSNFRTVDLLLYDVPQGAPKERGSAYEDPRPNTAESAALDGGYPIIG